MSSNRLKETLDRLNKYAASVKEKITSGVPIKHEGHEYTYRQYLQRELELTTAKIDALKLEGAKNGN